MKSLNSLLMVAMAVVVAVAFGAAVLVLKKRIAAYEGALQASQGQLHLPRVTSQARPTAAPEAVRVTPATAKATAPQPATRTPESSPPLRPAFKSTPTNGPDQKVVAQAKQSSPPAKEPLKDPVARVALAFVGEDPDAEAYWFDAINDPNLSANERQDLIEDLNEDGLPDPKHPTTDDLPLIINRLLIIEQVATAAMDQVNADAFQEAYKDLVNLANLAMGGGQPVR